MAEKSSASTYLYRFDYETPKSAKHLIIKDKLRGANHMDDLPYLFKLDGAFKKIAESFTEGTLDFRMIDRMTEMFVNFATHGRPTVEVSKLIPVHWKPVTDGTFLRHMIIDEDLTMGYTVNVEQKLTAAKQIKA